MTEILTPACPLCGHLPMMVMGGGTQAFCGNADGCDLLTWNPSVSREQNLANAGPARWEPSGGGVTTPHEPSAACGDTHCYSHGVDEPDEGTFLACLECRHVYRSAEEIRQEWTANAPPDLPDRDTPPPVEKIYFCPLCLHDAQWEDG